MPRKRNQLREAPRVGKLHGSLDGIGSGVILGVANEGLRALGLNPIPTTAPPAYLDRAHHAAISAACVLDAAGADSYADIARHVYALLGELVRREHAIARDLDRMGVVS